MQVASNQQNQRCECHECTQARWQMSIQGQMGIAALGSGMLMAQYPSPAFMRQQQQVREQVQPNSTDAGTSGLRYSTGVITDKTNSAAVKMQVELL